VTDEQIKIEKYRNGLQHDLKEMCRMSPAGTRWARVTDIIQYATLQWPAVQERIAKRKKSPGEVTKVAGKRKSSGGESSKSGKVRLSASAGLSDEQHKKNMAESCATSVISPDIKPGSTLVIEIIRRVER
jgi:hypothetical protein